MDDATARLADRADPGLTTQRLQEDILRKLDQVIASAQQSQGGSGSSSSSSSSPSSQSQPDQAGSQTSDGSSASATPGENVPGGSDDVTLSGAQGARARWGSLPDRLRDALTQGLDDPYSSLYRTLTERYYKKLAEQEDDDQ